MNPMRRFILLPIVAFLLLAASALQAAELTILAAASLTDALKEIGSNYEKQSGDKLVYNFAASSVLARQIQEGAPADVFISADEAKMDSVASDLATGTRKSILSNTLAVVVFSESKIEIHEIEDLTRPEIERIALAEPQSVPAGIYAKQYLKKVGLWKKVIDKVIPTENVRAALAAVEYGNVEVGMVYKTDVLISKKVRMALEVPAEEGPRISYPIAALKSSRQPEETLAFIAYVQSPSASEVFKRYGFSFPPADS